MPFTLSRLAAVGILGTAACGGDSELDLSPYTVDTRAAPSWRAGALVIHNDGTGWKAAVETSPGVFTFTPTGEAVSYGLVCPPDAGASYPYTSVSLFHQILTEDRRPLLGCWGGASDPARDSVTVTVIPDDASLGIGTISSWGPSSERTFELKPGPVDIVAMTASRALVRRDVTLPPAAPLVIDIPRDGADLQPLPVTWPATAPGEMLTASYEFRTVGRTVSSVALDTGRPAIATVPPAMTRDGDQHSLYVAAERGSCDRSHWLFGDSAADLAAIPALGDSFAGVTASWDPTAALQWTGLPEKSDYLSLSISQYQPQVYWSADVSGARLALDGQDLDGAWSPPDLSTVAGWQPSWNLDRTAKDRTHWYVSSGRYPTSDGAEFGSAGCSGAFSPAAPALSRRDRERDRDRALAVSRARR